MSDYMRSRKGEESDSFFCRFTFGQFFALLVLEVFTLFFVFYLGARYGREFLGLTKSAQVAAEDGAASAQEEPKVTSTTDPEAAQMAKELIAKADTPELKERITRMFENAKQGSEPKTPPVESVNHEDGGMRQQPVAPEPKAEIIQPGSRRPQEDEKPAELPERQATAESQDRRAADNDTSAENSGATDSSVIRVKSADHGRYSVQIGSYPQIGEATRVVDKWKNKGYSAYMMTADIPERGRWYRVRLGSFASHEDAARYLKDFQSKENVEALIVMNEQ